VLAGTALGTWALAAYGSFWVDAGSAETQAWVGHQLVGRGQWADAVKRFQTALYADGKNAEARIALGNVLVDLNRLGDAQQQFAKGLQATPANAHLAHGLALVLARQGQLDQAAELLERFVRLAPDDADCWELLGSVLIAQRRPDAAAEALRGGLGVVPAHAPIHLELARALAAGGHAREAVAEYGNALKWRPDWPPALTGLARLLATHPDPAVRDPPRAVRLAERANGLAKSGDAGILDTLAAAYAAAGRFAEAQAALERALRLTPASGPGPRREALQDRLRLYQARRPYLESLQVP
jgi:spermidine synthase